MYLKLLLVRPRQLSFFIDFHNENALSSLWQEPSISFKNSTHATLRHRTCFLVPFLYPFGIQRKTSEKTLYSHSAAMFETIQPTIYFHYENNVAALIDPARNHPTVGTRTRRTAVGNIGFGIQIKTRRKTLYSPAADEFEFLHPIIPFHYENGVSIVIHPVKFISLQKRVPCFRLIVTHLLISVSVSKENPEENHQKPYQDERHPINQWKSGKLL